MFSISIREFDHLEVGSGEPKTLSNFRQTHQVSQEFFDALIPILAEEDSPFRLTAKGKSVQAEGVVGMISLGPVGQIEILPKIVSASTDTVELKRVFFDMLHAVRGFEVTNRGIAQLQIDDRPMFEIYISTFIKSVEVLIKYGIKSTYVNVEENLGVFRGRLLFKDNLRENLLHPERFYVAYQDYSVDRPENRLIKTAIRQLLTISQDEKNLADLRRILFYFDEVPFSALVRSDLDSVRIDRTIEHYRDPLAWARLILEQQSPVAATGKSQFPSFTFPMDKLFEQYVAARMRKQVRNSWLTLTAQAGGMSLFDQPKKFRLRPDLLLTNSAGEPRFVMDTKWKRLDSRAPHMGISQADMYQMFAYSKKFKVPDVYLIYPETIEFTSAEQSLKFTSGVGQDRTTVHVRFIDLSKIDQSLAQLLESLPGAEF